MNIRLFFAAALAMGLATAANADTIDLLPGQSLVVTFQVPGTLFGDVQDLEVLPSFIGSVSPDEGGMASLYMGGDLVGSGIFDISAGWFGAFVAPGSSVAPAVAIDDFTSVVTGGAEGEFVYTQEYGDAQFDPSSITVELGSGGGEYYPQNSPAITSVSVVDEPAGAGVLAAGLSFLLVAQRRRRPQPQKR
jgi:hypothetical protein